jgi:hypothetical protein
MLLLYAIPEQFRYVDVSWLMAWRVWEYMKALDHIEHIMLDRYEEGCGYEGDVGVYMIHRVNEWFIQPHGWKRFTVVVWRGRQLSSPGWSAMLLFAIDGMMKDDWRYAASPIWLYVKEVRDMHDSQVWGFVLVASARDDLHGVKYYEQESWKSRLYNTKL